jgi:hypothetical protein
VERLVRASPRTPDAMHLHFTSLLSLNQSSLRCPLSTINYRNIIHNHGLTRLGPFRLRL